MLKKLFLCLVAAFFLPSAFAAFPATPGPTGPGSPTSDVCTVAPCYEFRVTSAYSLTWQKSAVVACQQYAPKVGQAYVSVTGSYPGPICNMTYMGGPVTSTFARQTRTPDPATYSCPSGATLSGTDCTCSAGFTQSGSSCLSLCESGQGRTSNVTVGWARSPNADSDDLIGAPYIPDFADFSDGVCKGSVASYDCFRSQVPSGQGLYRLSCDFSFVMNGEAATSAVSQADPSSPNATCPGFVGEVNGKTVCVGTPSAPLPPSQPAPNAPTGAGNPSAGVKPSSGEGSGADGAGRTPTGGSGGNAGGPASAAVGRGGTGDRDSDGEDPSGAVCGASPLPPCAVKVDETGTPAESTAPGRFGQANTDIGKVQSDAQGAFGDIENISLPSWTWTFSFPTGCTPLILPAFDDFEIDVCQFQPIIHDLMSVIWVIAGIWGLIALFRNATGV